MQLNSKTREDDTEKEKKNIDQIVGLRVARAWGNLLSLRLSLSLRSFSLSLFTQLKMTDRCCHTSFSLISLMNIHWCKSDVTNQSALFSFSLLLFLVSHRQVTLPVFSLKLMRKRRRKSLLARFFLFFSHFSFLIYHQSLTVTALAESPAREKAAEEEEAETCTFLSCFFPIDSFVVRRRTRSTDFILIRSFFSDWMNIDKLLWSNAFVLLLVFF